MNFLILPAGLLVVNLLSLTGNNFITSLFLGNEDYLYPLTFQNVMWGFFFLGISISYKRLGEVKYIQSFFAKNYLPKNFETILDQAQINEIIKATKKDSSKELSILPQIIFEVALQYQTNKSVSIATDILQQQIDLHSHHIELRYSRLKYLIWLIPTLGFMGTVYGYGLWDQLNCCNHFSF